MCQYVTCTIARGATKAAVADARWTTPAVLLLLLLGSTAGWCFGLVLRVYCCLLFDLWPARDGCCVPSPAS